MAEEHVQNAAEKKNPYAGIKRKPVEQRGKGKARETWRRMIDIEITEVSKI